MSFCYDSIWVVQNFFVDFGYDFRTTSLGLLVLVYVRRDHGHGLIHPHHNVFLISVSQNFPIF
jgi:hypothetical protein